MSGNLIGEYLRARRERVRPEEAGITANSHRRVPGLRRDEVAMLAGISTEYYTRLEQGRDRRPSAEVLDAIGRALGLDPDATAHLHRLAEPSPRRKRARRRESCPPSVAQLIDSWGHTPAYVNGRYLDVLAANRMASALSPIYRPGTNILRAVLLDPAAEAMLADPVANIAGLIAMLRAAAGADVDDPRLVELVGELSVKSELFRELWARHDVFPRRRAGGLHRIHHPQVGELDLQVDKFAVAGADDQLLVVYQAEPGSRSAEGLALLASLAAPAPARSP